MAGCASCMTVFLYPSLYLRLKKKRLETFVGKVFTECRAQICKFSEGSGVRHALLMGRKQVCCTP